MEETLTAPETDRVGKTVKQKVTETEQVKLLHSIRNLLILMVCMATGGALSALGSQNVGKGILSALGIYIVLRLGFSMAP